jgi:DNA-binding HxlR family transcriptional regulator
MARTASVPETPGPGRLAQPELPGRPCSIARALDLIGEKWALLAIREISFGNRRFNEIARNTGAPRDRLAARLHSLVEAGILERREYQSSPPRAEYHLTEAGRDLTPVLRALLAWGDRWVSDEPPATLMHGDHELDLVTACRHCGAEAAAPASLQVNSPGWDVRGPVQASELPGSPPDETVVARTAP